MDTTAALVWAVEDGAVVAAAAEAVVRAISSPVGFPAVFVVNFDVFGLQLSEFFVDFSFGMPLTVLFLLFSSGAR